MLQTHRLCRPWTLKTTVKCDATKLQLCANFRVYVKALKLIDLLSRAISERWVAVDWLNVKYARQELKLKYASSWPIDLGRECQLCTDAGSYVRLALYYSSRKPSSSV